MREQRGGVLGERRPAAPRRGPARRRSVPGPPRAPSPRRGRWRPRTLLQVQRAGRRFHEVALAARRTRRGPPGRPGRAIAIGRPGNPAPLPMSATRAGAAHAVQQRQRREAVGDVHVDGLAGSTAPTWPRAGRRGRGPAARPSFRMASASSDHWEPTASRRWARCASGPAVAFHVLRGARAQRGDHDPAEGLVAL